MIKSLEQKKVRAESPKHNLTVGLLVEMKAMIVNTMTKMWDKLELKIEGFSKCEKWRNGILKILIG